MSLPRPMIYPCSHSPSINTKGIQALERFVMRSKSPLVNGTVNILGVLAATSLAKSALRDGQLVVEIKAPYKGQASALWNDGMEGHGWR